MNPAWPCLRARGEGSALAIAVTPNAKRTGADGLHDGALRVRLAAPPVDGKANDKLVDWLADELGLPRRALRLAQGASARRKLVEIDLGADAVALWLERTLGAPPPPA
ncbi:MAG: DUF167 domain-containing protein [Burkholderiales bacterium]|nr:DUF167 domain-containing protein [Burkholderiales bacterium]